MTNEYDIFKRLKEYETTPPPEVMMRIFNSLDADKKDQDDVAGNGYYEQLQELEINPPAFIYSSIEQRIIVTEHLPLLKDFEVAPPAKAFTAIIDKINAENKWYARGGDVIKTLYRYRAVAAAVLIVLIGWLIYQVSGSSSPMPPRDITIKKNVPPAVIKTDTAQQKINTNDKTIAASEKKVKSGSALPAENFSKVKMSVGDYFFPGNK